MKKTELTVEIEGKNHHVFKRVRDECDTEPVIDYSMDQGDTWHRSMVEAYIAAKKSGKLIVVNAEITQAGEYEAFVVSLLDQVASLEIGESLKLVRTEAKIVVLREQAVLAVRASTIQEVNLSAEEN